MNADPRSAPRERARLPHRGVAFALAVAVHVVFLAVLIFSIRWQNRAPEPVTAELYAPIAVQPKVAPAPPPPAPKVEPTPTPPPPPPQVQPAPTPPPKPVVEPEKPDVRDAEIALKARKDEERKKRVEAEQRAQAEQQKRIVELQRQRELQKQKQLDDRKRADERKAADEKKAADARERQQREMTQMREQADKEMQQRANAETAARAQAARKTAESDYTQRIQAKIRGNVILPPDLSGNPEAIFDVVQLPTGEIIDVKLRKSSGAQAYDDAVQRAILKSSPLPKPDQPGMFQRVLSLHFRPRD
jgi:colicin import membrane protein